MSDFKTKMHQIRFPLGELTATWLYLTGLLLRGGGEWGRTGENGRGSEGTRGVQKVLQLEYSTIKKKGNVTNYTVFFNIIPEFNAFATFFWQTVNSTKIEIF